MGQVLVEKMLPYLDGVRWPAIQEATELGRRTFDVGLQKVDDFRGDPKGLADALRIFQSGDSFPYAAAGVAYTLVRASQEKDGSYSRAGLDAALAWLEKAQEIAPDLVEINMIEAFIYVYGDRPDDARLILDYLEGIDSSNTYLCAAEAYLAQRLGNLDEAVDWYQKAIDLADAVPRKLGLRHQLGDCYMAFKQYDKAAVIYQEAVYFAKEDALLWHQLSLAYWHKEDYVEAAQCNRKALAIQDFPEGRQMEAALRQKLGTGSLREMFFGRQQ